MFLPTRQRPFCAGAVLLACAALAAAQETKLIPADAAMDNFYGSAVAIDGDLAVVGCPLDDAMGENAGAVHVYTNQGGTWTFTQKLTADPPAAGELFGSALAISGNRLLVGAPGNDQTGEDCGAAYVFELSGGEFGQTAMLTSPGAGADQRFGHAVALWQDVALVGVSVDYQKAPYLGSAYVFVHGADGWVHEDTLLAPTAKRAIPYDTTLAVNGDVAVIGAPCQYDNGLASGSAYVYRQFGGTWQHEATLAPATARRAEYFGSAVAVFGDTIVVGARGMQMRFQGSPVPGAAYVFDYGEGGWHLSQALAPEQYAQGFGRSVAFDGGVLLVGAPDAETSVAHGGAVHVYYHDGTQWAAGGVLTPTSLATWDQFGFPLATSGGRLIAGAIRDDQAATNAGAVYIMDLPALAGCPGDADGDRDVDASDLLLVLSNYARPAGGPADGDFDRDGLVEADDLRLVTERLDTRCD